MAHTNPYTPTRIFWLDPINGLDGTGGHDGTTKAKAWQTLVYAEAVGQGLTGGDLLVLKGGVSTIDTVGVSLRSGTGSGTPCGLTGFPRGQKTGLAGTFTNGSVTVTGVTGLTLTRTNSETRELIINGKTYVVGKWLTSSSFELVLAFDQANGSYNFAFEADDWWQYFNDNSLIAADGWQAEDRPTIQPAANTIPIYMTLYNDLRNVHLVCSTTGANYICCLYYNLYIGCTVAGVSMHGIASASSSRVAGIGYDSGCHSSTSYTFKRGSFTHENPGYNDYLASGFISYYGDNSNFYFEDCCFMGYFSGWTLCLSNANYQYSRVDGPYFFNRCRGTGLLVWDSAKQLCIIKESPTLGNPTMTLPSYRSVTFAQNQNICRVEANVHQRLLVGCGVIKSNYGDANFGLPAGQTSIVQLLCNANSALYCAPIHDALESSQSIAYTLRTDPTLITVTQTLTQLKFRHVVNSQLSTLTNNQLWIEIINKTTGVITKTSSAAIPTAAGKDDWTHFVTSDAVACTAGDILDVRTFHAFYHASQMVGVGALEYSPDNGTTWFVCNQGWFEGEVFWSVMNFPASPGLFFILM